MSVLLIFMSGWCFGFRARCRPGWWPGVTLGLPWRAGRSGPFSWSGRVGAWSRRGGQCADLLPGQDEVGLVGVVLAQADEALAGAVDQPGGDVEQVAAQGGGGGFT